MVDMTLEMIDAQVAAYNARDVERLLSYYAPDAVIEYDATGQRVVGHEQLRKRYNTSFANHANDNIEAVVVNRICIGNYVVDEERGTDPSNPDAVHVVAIYRVEGGKIAHVRLLIE